MNHCTLHPAFPGSPLRFSRPRTPSASLARSARAWTLACAAVALGTWCATSLQAQALNAQEPNAQQAEDEGPKSTELPVRRAVLFTSGVGYFEHSGQVEGDAKVRLSFRAEQMNDVLKSMVAWQSSGELGQISYAANEPLSRALSSFGVDLSNSPTLPELLRQLRGVEIEVAQAGGPVRGRVLNVETRTRRHSRDADVVETVHHLQMVTTEGLVAIPLGSVTSVALADERLENELNRAMRLLASARDTQRKPVDVTLHGENEREARIGYVVEAPVWKSSYRLDLDATGQTERARLQCWAIVANTPDTDWRGVRLSLVSGRPISFVQDLYTPLYVNRPEVKTPYAQAVTPRRHAGGVETPKANMAPQAQAEAAQRSRAADLGAQNFGVSAMRAERADQAEVDLAEVAAQASGAQMGELFAFTVDAPVNLSRRESAMLPILNTEIEAEKLSIYNAEIHQTHPMNGAWLNNTTELALPAGPITVFEDDGYAGDAQIEDLPVDERRLISFGMDMKVTVDPSQRSSSQLTLVRISRGVLYATRQHTYRQTYAIKNAGDAPRSMLIEHPFRAERVLRSPEDYAEKTPEWYRFRVEAPASRTTEFVVEEGRPVTQTIALLDRPVSDFLWYSTNREVPRAVRDALEQVIAMKRELTELEQRREQKRQEKQQIESGQQRLRENLRTVGRDSNLGKRYLQKLADEEDRIEKLASEIASLTERINEQQEALAKKVEDLNVRG